MGQDADHEPRLIERIRFRDTEIACRMTGRDEAPWLVICHGMALDGAEFLPLAKILSQHWRILIWDMPGHGKSGPLPEKVSAQYMADALAHLVAHFKIDQMVLMGFSFGGVVAQYFARAHPDKLRALILHACFGPFSQEPLLPRWLVRPTVFLTFGIKPWKTVHKQFAANCVAAPADQRAAELAAERLGRKGFLAMTRALLLSFSPDGAFRIACPLLLISGDRDVNGANLKAAQDGLMAVAGHAKQIVLPNAGHCAHVDSPKAFAEAVGHFLTGVPATVGADADRSSRATMR